MNWFGLYEELLKDTLEAEATPKEQPEGAEFVVLVVDEGKW